MRFTIALNAICMMGAPLGISAFTPFPKSQFRLSTAIRVGSWDNDDFLDSLSSGPPSDGGEGESKSEKKSNEEESASSGASRLKKLMEAAKAAETMEKSVGPPPLNPFAPQAPNPYDQQQVTPPLNLENMSTEDQAAMFRQMMAQQQPQTPAVGYNVPPPPQKVQRGNVDAKGRKFGRNRDADSISNTSDLYFAQLKRDSSVRTLARYQGESDVANNIMGDEGVDLLNDQLISNPYLQRENRYDVEIYENVRDGMIEEDRLEKLVDKSHSGISYKDKLASRKNPKGTPATAAAPPQATPEPIQEPVQPAAVTPTPKESAQIQASAPDPVPQPVAVVAAPSPAPSTAATTVDDNDDAENIRKLRTLMGMFLKHRGGKGFGSGLLRGNEVDDFEALLKQVGGKLRAEAGPRDAVTLPTTSAPAVVVKPMTMTTPEPMVGSAEQDTGAEGPNVDAAIACIEGAVQMYKNSPLALQPAMLAALRAALASSSNTLDKALNGISPTQQQSIPVQAVTDVIDPAVVPEPEIEVEPTPIADPIPQPPKVVAAAQGENPGNDSNSQFFRKVHDSLTDASGEGKFGLGGVSAKQAEALADEVVEMRNRLMEELDAGIPEDDDNTAPNPSATVASPEEGSTVSKYKQMLAKARAAKAAKSQ